MKRVLGPDWSAQDVEAGARMAKAWKEFLDAGSAGQAPSLNDAELEGRIAAVRAASETALMQYPNVVGIADGIRMRGGAATGERALIVYVQRKVPEDQLPEGAVLPKQIDGIPVDVVEIGRVDALAR